MDDDTDELVVFSKLLSAEAILFEAERRLSELDLPDLRKVIEEGRETIATRLSRLQGRVYALCEAKRPYSIFN